MQRALLQQRGALSQPRPLALRGARPARLVRVLDALWRARGIDEALCRPLNAWSARLPRLC